MEAADAGFAPSEEPEGRAAYGVAPRRAPEPTELRASRHRRSRLSAAVRSLRLCLESSLPGARGEAVEYIRRGGTWQVAGVVDYAAKVALACLAGGRMWRFGNWSRSSCHDRCLPVSCLPILGMSVAKGVGDDDPIWRDRDRVVRTCVDPWRPRILDVGDGSARGGRARDTATLVELARGSPPVGRHRRDGCRPVSC